MKSAYELAMERLEREDPSAGKPLSDAQKAELATIDERYKAKKAEREIFLKQQLAKEQSSGNHEAISQIEKQLVNELARLEDEKEAAKEAVRNS
ncbi:hypothetical protein [Coraliomargarita parva]|uniref:hypothetical protein n=1 Tax=Coraliomargarita parva TaxID=3014050 RepID=UPI0022B4AE3B|nr:hypothetical protein [Coraliomargarita parva]